MTFSDEARTLLDYVRYARDCSTSDAVEHLMARLRPRETLVTDANGLIVFAADDGPPITLEDMQFVDDQEFVYLHRKQTPTPRRTSVRISPETSAVLKNYLEKHNELTSSKALCELLLATERL